MEELMFSVAVLTYNQEKWVAQMLESVLNQEHDYKYEIIVGDDFSTDGTRAIIQKYAAEYPDVVKPIFNEKNIGLIKNYFNVIDHCSGKYIMGVAGDDYWLPEKVATQIEFMESHPDVDMCYGKARVWDESANEIYKEMPRLGEKRVDFEDVLLHENIPALTVCSRLSKVLKYIEDINPVEKGWATEDLPMWLYISKTGKFSFLDEWLAVYRVISGSVAHPTDIEKKIQFKWSLYNIKKYFDDEKKYYTAIDKMFFPQFLDLYREAGNKAEYFKIYRKLQIRIGSVKSVTKAVVSFFPFFQKSIFLYNKIRIL